MNVAELLRKLADMIDQKSAPTDDQPVLSPPEQEPTPEPAFDKMIPPLQQKMELLKKVAGVPNEFDGQETDQDCELEQDEIAIMRKNAGMNPVAIVAHETADDNDITG